MRIACVAVFALSVGCNVVDSPDDVVGEPESAGSDLPYKGGPILSAITANPSTGPSSGTPDEPSESQVNYGLDTTYSSSTTLNTAMVTSHSQTLTGLTANTLYHYTVRSRDAASNRTTSADQTFTYLPSGSP